MPATKTETGPRLCNQQYWSAATVFAGTPAGKPTIPVPAALARAITADVVRIMLQGNFENLLELGVGVPVIDAFGRKDDENEVVRQVFRRADAMQGVRHLPVSFRQRATQPHVVLAVDVIGNLEFLEHLLHRHEAVRLRFADAGDAESAIDLLCHFLQCF